MTYSVHVSVRALRIATGTSIIALTLAGTAAKAQPASTSDQPGVGLEDIVVTARKVAENLQDVPVAVTVLSGDDLAKRSAVRFQDIAAYTPGLYIRSGSNSPSAITVSLRGQFQSDTLATLDPSVGTYVDGVYWARAYGLNGGFLDVSSVQALKGPQGTLFGRNTTGGAILIDSNDPKIGEFSGKVSASYGRFNETEPTAIINVPLGDKIALRLAGKYLHRDGYTTNSVSSTAASIVPGNSTAVARPAVGGNLNGIKMDNRERWQGRAKLLIEPTDTLKLIFSAEYFHMDETGPSRSIVFAPPPYTAANSTFTIGAGGAAFVGGAGGVSAGLAAINAEIARLAGDPNTVANNEIPYVFTETQTYNFNGALDTGWGEVRLIASWRKVKANAGFDIDGSQYAIHFTESQQQLKQQSAELQVTGKAFDDAVDFAGGAFVFHESGYDQSISITTPTLNPNTSHFYGLIDNDSIGLYGQSTWHITEKFSFTGGVRYSADDKGLETRNNNYNRNTGLTSCLAVTSAPLAIGQIVGPTQCAFKRRDSFTGWSYTAGIEYKPTQDILLYAKTAKGFRSGGENLRAPSRAALLPFGPEIAYSYEVGVKAELLDRKLRVNLAAYTTDVNGIQRSTLVSVPPVPPATAATTATLVGNAGKARFRGIEAEVTARVADHLTLSASGSYIDPKYINYADLTGDRSFERFNGVSKYQFTLGADYSAPLSEKARLNLHVDYNWRGATPLDSYNYPANPNNAAIVAALTAPPTGLLNARASVDLDQGIEIGVFARNLTDNRSYSQNQLVAPIGYISATRQEPRTYGVTASYSF